MKKKVKKAIKELEKYTRSSNSIYKALRFYQMELEEELEYIKKLTSKLK